MEDLQVERRIVSVLFADIVGFTSLSENLDPEDVAAIQNAYISLVQDTIGRYRGQIEKFIGDAAMAVFGIPKTRDDDAERAARAALALVSGVEQLNAQLGFESNTLALRVGVNTGEVAYSTSPGMERVTGDTVNVAARLQTAAQPGGVLLGRETALSTAAAVAQGEELHLDLKGKAVAVSAIPALGVHPQPSREIAMGTLRAPTLGREDEIKSLLVAMEQAESGTSCGMLLVGPPGIGKTRLLEEFRSRAVTSSTDVRILRARLREDLTTPFAAVAQLIVDAAAAEGVQWSNRATAIGAIERLLIARGAAPGRAAFLAGTLVDAVLPDPDAAEGPAVDRDVMFTAWSEGLDLLSGENASVWLIEDLHWGGPDLMGFLAGLGPRESHGRVVIANARPSLLETHPFWNEPPDPWTSKRLEPLSSFDTSRLIKALVGDALPRDLAAKVAERSDGNALFVEELLRGWVSTGTLISGEGGAWQLADPDSEVPLPSSVQAIYSAQIDDLSPPARLVARRGSVAGRRFPSAALGAFGVVDPGSGIDALLQMALLSGPETDVQVGASFRYRHALLRDAAYRTLARSDRAMLHVRLAKWLEALAREGPDIAESIANHYSTAIDTSPSLAKEIEGITKERLAESAADWFEVAAGGALAVGAHESARDLLRRSLARTPEGPSVHRVRRMTTLGETTAHSADMDAGRAILSEAFELATDLFARSAGPESRAVYGRTTFALGMLLYETVRFTDVTALATKALEVLSDNTDVETARIKLLLAWGAEGEGDDDLCMTLVREAHAGAERFGDPVLLQETRRFLLYDLKDQDEAKQWFADVEEGSRALKRWDLLAEDLRQHAVVFASVHGSRSYELLNEAEEVATTHGLVEVSGWINYARAEVGCLLGDWDVAVDRGGAALDLAERNRYARLFVRSQFVLAPIAEARRDAALMGRLLAWQGDTTTELPGSSFGKVMVGSLRLFASDLGMAIPFAPEPEVFVPFFGEEALLPSLRSALERILLQWLTRGDLDAATNAVDAYRIGVGDELTPLGGAVGDLFTARVAAAKGDKEDAVSNSLKAELEFKEIGAAWWRAKAIRVLDEVDASYPVLTEEAGKIEERLGVRRSPQAVASRSSRGSLDP